jgi:hypothetical protein
MAKGPQEAVPDRLIKKPAARRNFWMRLILSRRVRVFFLFAVVAHVLAIWFVSTNKQLHDWFFDDGAPAKPVTLSNREIDNAVETLVKLNQGKFGDSLRKLHEYRVRLDVAQRSKLKAMRAEDEDRKKKIAEKAWPSLEKPDPNAVYFARMDIEPPPFPMQPLPDLDQLNLVELYRLHESFEGEVGKLFERYHAMELAASLESPLPLSKSLEVTKLELPNRRKIRPDILSTRALDQKQLDAFRKELTDLYLETQDMVNNAARWVEMAESTTSSFSLSTLFGQAANIIPAPEPYYGHYLNPRYFRAVEAKRLINPRVALGTAIGDGEMTGGAQWLSLDKWYYVGPFTHPGENRKNERRMEDLHYKYPPESGVDLDAVYKGRDGRELRWKYRTFGRNELLGKPSDDALRIFPYTVDNESYAIWYFYTEVWSDSDRRVVASFASDDFGKCWLNGTLVYQSPPDTQPWVPFTREGFRPIQLRKGYNRVMYKLENWTGTTGFSLVLMTYEDFGLLKAIEEEARRSQ